MSVEQSARERVADSLREAAATDPEMDGALLLGFVAIAEWMTPNGERWLSTIDGAANGEECASWTVQGYLHNALFHPDGFGREDEDDGDD